MTFLLSSVVLPMCHGLPLPVPGRYRSLAFPFKFKRFGIKGKEREEEKRREDRTNPTHRHQSNQQTDITNHIIYIHTTQYHAASQASSFVRHRTVSSTAVGHEIFHPFLRSASLFNLPPLPLPSLLSPFPPCPPSMIRPLMIRPDTDN